MVQLHGLLTQDGLVEGKRLVLIKLKNSVNNTLSHSFQKPLSFEITLALFLVVQNCSYGSGSRIKLSYTRKIIDAIHSGNLLNAEYKKTQIFGLEIPTEVDGVPSEILDPENTVSGPKIFNHYHYFSVFQVLQHLLEILFDFSGQTNKPTRRHC